MSNLHLLFPKYGEIPARDDQSTYIIFSPKKKEEIATAASVSLAEGYAGIFGLCPFI
jgi:hypothetical protein